MPFDLSVTLGNLLTVAGLGVGWYFSVRNFRRQDAERIEQARKEVAARQDRLHEENQTRLDKLENCFHRHLGQDTDMPIRDRILNLEKDMNYIREDVLRRFIKDRTPPNP